MRKEPVAAVLTTAMRYCDNDQRLQLISSLQERCDPKTQDHVVQTRNH